MYYNNDFGYDLRVGQVAEEYLASIIENKKIEVKLDKIAHKTGRVFVEYECRGKASGITTTEADFWAFVLVTDVVILVSKNRLTELCNQAYENGRSTNGGDNNSAKGFLIELSDLMKWKI